MALSIYKKTSKVQHIVYPVSIKEDLLEVVNQSIEVEENIFIGFQIFGSMLYCIIQPK